MSITVQAASKRRLSEVSMYGMIAVEQLLPKLYSYISQEVVSTKIPRLHGIFVFFKNNDCK
jgi:hypothetical protein